MPAPPSSTTRAQAPSNVLGMILAGMGFLGLLVLLVGSLRSRPEVPRATARPVPAAHAAPTKPAPTPGVPASLPVRVLTNERLGFEIEIPRGWVAEPEENGYAISPPDDSADSKEIWGLVMRMPRRKGETLEEQLLHVKGGMRELFKLVIDGEDKLTLAGHPALRLRFHHFQSVAGADYSGITVIVERPGDFLILALHCAAERRKQYEPIVDHIINSLHSTASAP